MWKPSSVVPQHRNRAIVVWVAIFITALAYTVWQTTVVIRKRQNPSTRLMVSNQQYQYPPISVCFEHGSGCGFADGNNISTCIASAIDFSSANLDGLRVDAIQGQADNCIDFDLTQIQIPEADRETDPGLTAYIIMDWVSSDNATAEHEYRAGVSVILGSSESPDATRIPYSRNVYSSSDRNYETTVLSIGKTSRKHLSGNLATNYPVQTISTTRFVTTKDFDIFSPDDSYSSSVDLTENSAIGSIFLEITQGFYSHTQVEDVEPLEIGALFGNVGGFWELLVVAWGVFFITTSRDKEPTLTARNFLQSVASKDRKRRKLDSAAAEKAGHDGPRPLDWDSGDDGRNVSGASDSGASEKMGKEVFTVNGIIISGSDGDGDFDKARKSFFPTPQAFASRIHPGSEDESSRSATANNFVEKREGADEDDLELGYAGEWEDRHGEE